VKTWIAALALAAACGHPRAMQGGDAATDDGNDGNGDAQGGGHDASGGGDGSTVHQDAAVGDAGGHGDAPRDGATGVITGGPCMSGAAGQAAYRIRWANAQGTAYVVYEIDGLPDTSRDRAGAYGYQIGFTPSYVDPFLAQGGLQLDDSDFVDLEISTVGVHAIDQATLSIYGRSFDVTTSGSFNWQTFVGTGSSPTDSVSNVAPYAWYSADMTTELAAQDGTTLIRIKAGLSSDTLVVNRIELCLQAH
jgi:hypothetical protein